MKKPLILLLILSSVTGCETAKQAKKDFGGFVSTVRFHNNINIKDKKEYYKVRAEALTIRRIELFNNIKQTYKI